MSKKYRVNEVAKDLGLQNKDVLNVLEKYTEEPKKNMTALEEKDLDVIFENFTQSHQVANFNEYFKSASLPKEEKKAEAKPQEKKPEAKKNDNRGNQKNDNRKPQNNQNRNGKSQDNRAPQNKANKPQENRAPQHKPVEKANKFDKFERFKAENAVKADNKPQQSKKQEKKQPAQARPKQETLSIGSKMETNTSSGAENFGSTRRVVDTRTTNINIDKYNEKYDSLAFDKVRNETTASKQKFTNRKQQKGKKQGKRETEAERLNRIAQERKAKSMTITVPDEITVGDFALKLKATSAEVIKKLMMMGVFATINDTIDFDTASLIADEFHAKVEKAVVVTIAERIIDGTEDDDANRIERAQVVGVMGHVDQGKTYILDAIRHSDVTAG